MNEIEIFQNFITEFDTEFKQQEGFYDSKHYLESLFSTPLNWDTYAMQNKINTFCSFFFDYVSAMEKPKIAEYYSGVGTFLKLMKRLNSNCETFFVNELDSNSTNLAKRILSEEHNFCEASSGVKYDVILSDAVFNYLTDEEIMKMISKINEDIANEGLFFLLVNMDPNTLRKDFDIRWIHEKLQGENMICLWGQNSFCSLWNKK